MRTSIKVKIFVCLLVLGFFVLPIVFAEITTYPVQKAICRKGFDAPATPTDCTSELTTSDDTRFRLNTDISTPAYVNATWNISLHSDFSIDETKALIEWNAGGDVGRTVLDWYYYNEINSTYQLIGCSNSTSLVKDTDQIDICNVTWIYNAVEDITNIKLETKFRRLDAKKDVNVDYFAINLTYFDRKAPSVFGLLPISNFTTNVSSNIEISANVTDYSVDTTLATITYPNSTMYQIELFQYGSTDKYNNSFTIPNLEGRYNISFVANDTYGNINNTEKTWFNLIFPIITPPDTTLPQVWNVTPKAGSNFSLDSIVDITANVTDNVAVDTVFANITNPDLSVVLLQLFDDDNDDIYNNTVIADQPGWYYITIIANDTSGNVNNTVKTNFDPASLGGGNAGGGGAASEIYRNLPDWKKYNDVTIIPTQECMESWLCAEWTECSKEGNQTRECDDWNKCGTEKTKPLTERECEYVKKKKESQPRYATSLLLSRKQTFTAIGGVGIAAIIILLGVSIYLLYRKEDKKRKTKTRKRTKIKINMMHRLQNKYKNV